MDGIPDSSETYWTTTQTPAERAAAEWAAWADRKEQLISRLLPPVGTAPDTAEGDLSFEEWADVFRDSEALTAAKEHLNRIRQESGRRLKEMADALGSPLPGGVTTGKEHGRAELPPHHREAAHHQQPHHPGR
jgi:hypothetical protein